MGPLRICTLALLLVCAACAATEPERPPPEEDRLDPLDLPEPLDAPEERPRIRREESPPEKPGTKGILDDWWFKWRKEPAGSLHFGIGAGTHYFAGGKLDRVAEQVDTGVRVSFAYNIPVAKKKAAGPYLLWQSYEARIKHSEMSWNVNELGGGCRFLLFDNDADLYLRADGTYVLGAGIEDDTISHPGFDRTLFRRDDPNQFEPRNLYGYALGVGIGFDVFRKTPFALGMEVGYRYQWASEGFDAHFIEITSTVTLRF